MDNHPLKNWRAEQSLTQAEAGKLLGLSRWTINQIEKGAYKPSASTAKDIATATGIDRAVFRPDIFEVAEHKGQSCAA